MDASEFISSATQIVSSMVGTIGALEQASWDLDEAPKRIKSLEEFILNALVQRLHPNITKARGIVSNSKRKSMAKIVQNSVAGDPLGKLVSTIRDDLNWWLESQRLMQDVEKGSHRVILIVGLSGIGKSCMARQVGSDPSANFVDGAVQLGFGQWCSRAACNGNRAEYQKRLARKICKFLVQIGFWKKIEDENTGDLEYIRCLLQEALYGKSILILLDDVWEQDIVERFAKLYDNDCKYLVTTRNEAVYEITEAEKVELGKDDTTEMGKAILLYHSLLSEEELPSVAESLLERCGHHPLTVAVMGKALRKEIRAEKWEKATTNLSTFATCAPGPVSYVNEKEAENTLTIFGSFEFSLEAMPGDSRKLFIALAAISWAEPVPEACLEAIWSVLGQEMMFPLIVCKLVEGSLLMKTDTDPLYQVHDMVSLYLDSKTNDSVVFLVNESSDENKALICPWLFIFGKESVKRISEQKIETFLSVFEEKQAVTTIEAIIKALMASKTISDFEASRATFVGILGPRIEGLISSGSQGLVAVSAEAITNIFNRSDYCNYFPSFESTGAVEKLSMILENCEDPKIQTNISIVLAKLAEFGSSKTVNKVLQSIHFNQLADLLSPDAEEWHESMFTILMSLTIAGKSKAVERMIACESDKNLIKLLENGTEVVQHHAIVTLKAFYELGGCPTNGFLQPANLNLLPWQNVTLLPKPQILEDLIHMVLDSNYKQVMEAMQDLIPIVEKAGNPKIRDMILNSPLIKRLSELLQSGNSQQSSMKSESAFLLMKLACAGGEPCIKKYLEYDIIPELVKMVQCTIVQHQDAAYTALHQMLFGSGGVLVLKNIFQMGLIEKMAHSIESKSMKTREINVHCLLDIVELGNKKCLERMFSLQVVEKLAKLEKLSGGSGETVVGFLKGIDKCKHLSQAERRVMKQQVVRKVRVAMKGHKFESRILAGLDACASEGSIRGASSSGRK
ncbi:hypothetical protein ACB092_05G092800 [Castanea dentata]